MRSPRGLRTDAESESEISVDDDQSTEAGGISIHQLLMGFLQAIVLH